MVQNLGKGNDARRRSGTQDWGTGAESLWAALPAVRLLVGDPGAHELGQEG